MSRTIRQLIFDPYARPTPKSVTMAGRPAMELFGWHVRLESNCGLLGLGDIAPWPGFSRRPGEIGPELIRLGQRLMGQTLPRVEHVVDWIDGLGVEPVVAHGLELAILDILAQEARLPLAQLLNPQAAMGVRTHALVSRTEDVHALLESGVETLKVKLSGEREFDRRRIAAIRAIAPRAKLRVDANGCWTAAGAVEAIREISEYGITMVEQPVPGPALEDFAWVSQRAATKVSADESFAYDPEGTVGIPGLSEIVIKPMFLGGVARAFHWARRIRDTGLGVCITHAFESNVGRMGALHLSAALNDRGTHGVSTARPENPSWADVPTAAGIGVSI